MKTYFVVVSMTLVTGCFQPTFDALKTAPDASSDVSCGPSWDGGCDAPDLCTTVLKQTCVTASADGHSSCLGVRGAGCQSDCECVSGSCAAPLQVDCFPPMGCGPPGPEVCGASPLGGACLSSDDCSYGECQNATAHTAGSCCASARLQCHSDADCCAGLSCATDNTGCRVGPTPTCLIDGGTVASGAANPSNDCQVCDPYTSPTAWKNLGEPQDYHPPCGPGPHPGGVGPGINYCCAGVCTDSCSQ